MGQCCPPLQIPSPPYYHYSSLIINQNMSQSPRSHPQSFFQNLKAKLKNPTLFEAMGKRFIHISSSKIQQQIQNQTIQLPPKLGSPAPLVKKPPKQEKSLNESDILKMIEEEKEVTLEKLKDIEGREYEIKKKKRLYSLKENPKFKSSLTQEDKERLKKLIHATRKYQYSLDQKTKALKKMLQEKSLQNVKEKQKEIQQLRNQRRQAVLANLKSMQLKQEAKSKQYQRSKELQKEIQQKKYLHQEISQRYDEYNHQRQKQYKEIIDQIKARFRLDMEEIREHERRYERILEENREKSQNKSKLFQGRHVSFGENYFSLMVKNKMEQQKIEQLNRMNYGHQMKEKVDKYQSYINKSFKPKISNKSKFTPQKQAASAQSLSSIDRRNKGIQYLDVAKRLKDKEKERQRRHTQLPPRYQPYKDYLKDLKFKEHDDDETQLRSMIKKGKSMSDYESASRALLLAEKIDAKNKQTNDKKIYNSVKTKLQILKALE